MKVGYARTSSVDQMAGFEAQLEELRAAGCEKIFHEQVSSIAKRPQLQAAIEFVRESDVFVVTKIDRMFAISTLSVVRTSPYPYEIISAWKGEMSAS